MGQTPDLMPDGTPAVQPIEKAASFSVYPCDGFATSFVRSGDDATFQFGFWMDDTTPVSEDFRKPISDPGHFTITLKHTFQTSIKLNPNIAMQLAFNILANLTALPDNVKDRYGIPRTLSVLQKNVP
jgi:hypothetical protein